jgi:hypothetical protein
MIKISTYGHSIIVAIIGLWTVLLFPGWIGYFFGGSVIGLGLRLARQSGFDDCENK